MIDNYRAIIHQLEDWYAEQPPAAEAIYVALDLIAARTNANGIRAALNMTILTGLNDLEPDDYREILIDTALNINWLTIHAPLIAATFCDLIRIAADHDSAALDALEVIEDSRADHDPEF